MPCLFFGNTGVLVGKAWDAAWTGHVITNEELGIIRVLRVCRQAPRESVFYLHMEICDEGSGAS